MILNDLRFTVQKMVTSGRAQCDALISRTESSTDDERVKTLNVEFHPEYISHRMTT